MKKYIVSVPDILSGIPVIVGTRVPIATIIYQLRHGYSLKEIDEMYPWITMPKLKGALNELAIKLESRDEIQESSQAQIAP